MYITFSYADRILLPERLRLTFVLATAASGVTPRQLATRIAAQTGLQAHTADNFKADTGIRGRWLDALSRRGDRPRRHRCHALYVRHLEPLAVRGAQRDGCDSANVVGRDLRTSRNCVGC
jgi:hypothetical protein